MTLFEEMGPNHKDLVKEAFVGALAKPFAKGLLGVGKLMGRAGKVVVKNPLKSFGYAASGSEGVNLANRMSGSSSPGANLMTAAGNM